MIWRGIGIAALVFAGVIATAVVTWWAVCSGGPCG